MASWASEFECPGIPSFILDLFSADQKASLLASITELRRHSSQMFMDLALDFRRSALCAISFAEPVIEELDHIDKRGDSNKKGDPSKGLKADQERRIQVQRSRRNPLKISSPNELVSKLLRPNPLAKATSSPHLARPEIQAILPLRTNCHSNCWTKITI